MKTHPKLPFLLLLIAACGTAAPSRGHAQLIDLTDNATVRTNGTYTYYAEQTAGASSYFTTAFYPGPANHDSSTDAVDWDGTLDDAVATPGAISIGAGELTDYSGGLPNTASTVGGWVGTTSYLGTTSTAAAGSFDILFNLGAVYSNISEVVVNYTDATGHRFTATANAQSVFYGVAAPGATLMGGLTPFGSSSVVPNTVAGAMTFTTGSPVSAQYIDVRLNVSVNGSGFGSVGGYVNSIQILSVPEPSSVALLFGFLPVWWLAGRARKIASRA